MPKNKLIDSYLLAIKKVPAQIVQAEKVTERLLAKKLTRKQKTSVKYSSALANYKKAVRRYKLAETLLQKHFKTLSRIVSKYGSETETPNSNPQNDAQ